MKKLTLGFLMSLLMVSPAIGGSWNSVVPPLDYPAGTNDYIHVYDHSTSLIPGQGGQAKISFTGNASDFLNGQGQMVPESDPFFASHAAFSVTSTGISNWDTAFSWGNHADAGYLTSYLNSWIGQTDTPVSYTGFGGYYIAVNPGETGPEFVLPPSGTTNLTNTPGTDNVVVESSSGASTSILAATTTTAGVMSAADKLALINAGPGNVTTSTDLDVDHMIVGDDGVNGIKTSLMSEDASGNVAIVGSMNSPTISSGGNTVSYANSTVNFGKMVEDLGDTYDVLQFNKFTLSSTLDPGPNTVGIGLWQRADLLGGTPNHMVGLLGEATSSDGSTPGMLIGVEGKAYANIDGSNITSILALSYLNSPDNSNNTAYGLQANVSALQGAGTGNAVAGFFNASGGINNYDIMLAGQKNIAGWNSEFTGINYINFLDTGISIVPLSGGKAYVGTDEIATVPIIDSLVSANTDVVANTAKVSYPGDELTSDEQAAVAGANSPSSTNVIATMDDIVAGSGDVTAAANLNTGTILIGDDGSKGVKTGQTTEDASGNVIIAGDLSVNGSILDRLFNMFGDPGALLWDTGVPLVDDSSATTGLWTAAQLITQLGLKEDALGNPSSDAQFLQRDIDGTTRWTSAIGGSIKVETSTGVAPSPGDYAADTLVMDTSAGDMYYQSATGLYTLSGTYAATPVTYSLDLSFIGVNGDSITVNGTAYSTDTIITGLSGVETLTSAFGGTNDTVTWSGTDSGLVTGTPPNETIDMGGSNRALVATFSGPPVVDTRSDNLPLVGTSTGTLEFLPISGAAYGGYFQIATENVGKHLYSMHMVTTVASSGGSMECRVGATTDLDSYFARAASVEPFNGTVEFLFNDTTTALDDTTVYYWACTEDNGVTAKVSYSDALDDSGYNYGSGDWQMDHVNDGSRDSEVEFYVY